MMGRPRNLTLESQILDVLQTEPSATDDQIGEKLGVSGRTVRRRLFELRQTAVIKTVTSRTHWNHWFTKRKALIR